MAGNTIKRLGVIMCVIALFIYYFPQTTHATCALNNKSFLALESIQNNFDLDYLEKIKSELVIRKNLLRNTVDCAIEEANGTKSELESVAANGSDLGALQSQLHSRLEDEINYYEIEDSKIDDLGLQGSRVFAQNLKNWREGNSRPVAKTVANLSLWHKNQDLIEKTRARVSQVSHTIDFIKIVGSDEIQALWKDAQSHFQDALDFNQEATLSLKENRSADDSLDIMKSSLEALSKTYQKFLDISAVFSRERSL